jgi:hypothetical protein
MSLLKFDDESPKTEGSNKSLKYLLGIGALVGTIVLSSTIAASINLNAGGPVEFGQGVVQTTACDDEITVTPISTFVNAAGYGSHMFTSLRISGIDSSEGKCSGKRFLIKAYGDNGILDIFNYYEEIENFDSDPTVIQEDYDSIEIANNGGEFTWVSGGSDDGDVIPGSDDYITDTSFTIDFAMSLGPPIVRTPLALSEDVKRITVETYDINLLADRVLTSSQVALFLGVDSTLEDGLDGEDDPLLAGNFDGTCELSTCFPYFTIRDWISNAPESDINNFNDIVGTTGITRSQIISQITAKFTYDPSAELEERWNMQFLFAGVNLLGFIGAPFEAIQGYVIGFDGNTGAFVPYLGGEESIFFSLNSALQNNPSIGPFIPYGDQTNRTLPIRDFAQIWSGSEVPYYE